MKQTLYYYIIALLFNYLFIIYLISSSTSSNTAHMHQNNTRLGTYSLHSALSKEWKCSRRIDGKTYNSSNYSYYHSLHFSLFPRNRIHEDMRDIPEIIELGGDGSFDLPSPPKKVATAPQQIPEPQQSNKDGNFEIFELKMAGKDVPEYIDVYVYLSKHEALCSKDVGVEVEPFSITVKTSKRYGIRLPHEG